MAVRCEQEFNPWPSFVDIFSSVILVLLLFLLVTIVNIGYYAQFKYKVQYTGSIATDELILHDTSKTLKVDKLEKKIIESTKLRTTDLSEATTQPIQEFLTAATDIESAGVDMADILKKEEDSEQITADKDLLFYVTYTNNQIFIDQAITDRVKEFIKNSLEKYPKARVQITTKDPTNQLSATITRQISLGRAIGARNLVKKFEVSKKDIIIKLNLKTFVPQDMDSKFGTIIIEILTGNN